MAIILFVIAVSLSAIAAFYAVSGLVAIFAAAAVPIAIMGGVLETGKLVVASWLYRRWSDIGFLMKAYFTAALVVLMLLTSMGIFGFLSKSHLDQAGESGVNDLRIEQIERQIARENKTIEDAETVLAQLDKSVQVLIDYDRIRGKDGAIAVRENQKPERQELTLTIKEASDNIAALEDERQPLLKQKLDLELEIGPLKYVAEFIYGDEASSHFDEAVRWVILAIIFVFDPLAVMMLIAWNREVMLRTPKEEVSDLPDWDYKAYEQARAQTILNNDYDVSEPRPVKREPPIVKKNAQKSAEQDDIAIPPQENSVPAEPKGEPTPDLQEYGSDVQEQVFKPTHGRPDRLK